MKSLNDIAAALQGYDASALPAGKVNEFLAALVQLIAQVQKLPYAQAFDQYMYLRYCHAELNHR